MKYFRLVQDVHVANRWYLGQLFVEDTNEELNLFLGEPFPRGIAPWVEITDKGIPLDFCETAFAVPVVKTHLANVISTFAGAHVERVPLKIDGFSGFEVMNITRVIKCLDETRTDFTKYTESDDRPDLLGGYKIVVNLKIVSDGLPSDAHIFCIEGWTVAFIVSEDLKCAMEECGCLGAKFIDVS